MSKVAAISAALALGIIAAPHAYAYDMAAAAPLLAGVASMRSARGVLAALALSPAPYLFMANANPAGAAIVILAVLGATISIPKGAVAWTITSLRKIHPSEMLFFVLAALQAGAVWLHRSFPTQDGPMQIYLADVLQDLIRGTGHYSSYYQTQGYAHPYSFSLYALLLLNQAFHPLTSERILVCLYFVAFAYGARFLIRSVYPENRWLALFILPFAMNSYLALGIYNFSFGVALLMVLMGLWLRWSGAWTLRRSLLWLALLLLLAAMHHVPLLVLGVFVTVHVAGTAIGSERASRLHRLRGDLVHGAMLMVPLGWYAVFAIASAHGVPPTISAVPMSSVDRIRALMEMIAVSPYLRSGYSFCLVMVVVTPAALFLLRPKGVQFKPKAVGGASFALAITGLTCLALYAFGPHFLFGHGHGYFAERMAVPFVICVLAAAAPLRLPLNLEKGAAAFLACLFVVMLSVRFHETKRIVADLAPLYDAKPANGGLSGAIISGQEGMPGFTFNPYFWAGALYAEQSKSVLLNASWTYEPIALFGTKNAHPWDGTSSHEQIRRILLDSVPALPRMAFVCGGKWDSSSPDSGLDLAQRNGLNLVFDSGLYYCYGDVAPARPIEALSIKGGHLARR